MIKNKTNILFIIIDSARYDHFSISGYDKKTTPFLESLQNDLTVYLNANTPAAWTRPAMTSIFTGLYPEQYGFFDENYLSDDMPLLTEILQRKGYQTHLISNNAYMSPATGFSNGADRFYYLNKLNFLNVLDKSIILKNSVGILKQYMNPRTTYKAIPKMMNDQAIKIIHQAASSSNPFFLYLHHDAHHPYLSDRKYLKEFLDRDITEAEICEVESIQRSGNMYQFNRDDIPADKRDKYYEILSAMHDASIYKNDIMLSALFRSLQANNLYDNTMVIVAADHGEFLGEQHMISHGLDLFEEVVRVPLLIKYPKDLNMSGSTDRLVSTIDLMPAILELAGEDRHLTDPNIQGISLLSEKEHDFVVCQKKVFGEGLDLWEKKYPGHSFFREYDRGNLICFKDRTTKFIWSSKGKHKLFNLEKDPIEDNDIYSMENIEHQHLLAKYLDWMGSVPKVTGENIKDFDEAMKEQLRGLGYIE